MSDKQLWVGLVMKSLGCCLIVLSIIEFGVGGAAYGFLLNIHIGSWWGGICSFAAGICGFFPDGRLVTAGLILSVLSIILSGIGAVIDGIAYSVLSSETGCMNTDNGKLYGTLQGQREAQYCAVNNLFKADVVPVDSTAKSQAYNLYYNRPYDDNRNFFYNHPNWEYYYNRNHYDNWYRNHNIYYWDQHHLSNNDDDSTAYGYQCMCSNDEYCFGYDLTSGTDCGSILSTYTNLLNASTAILCAISLLSLTYYIIACMGCGRSDSKRTISRSGTRSGSAAYSALPPVPAEATIEEVELTPLAEAHVLQGQSSESRPPKPVIESTKTVSSAASDAGDVYISNTHHEAF